MKTRQTLIDFGKKILANWQNITTIALLAAGIWKFGLWTGTQFAIQENIIKTTANLKRGQDSIYEMLSSIKAAQERQMRIIGSLDLQQQDTRDEIITLKNNYIKFILTGQKDILELLKTQPPPETHKPGAIEIHKQKINKP